MSRISRSFLTLSSCILFSAAITSCTDGDNSKAKNNPDNSYVGLENPCVGDNCIVENDKLAKESFANCKISEIAPLYEAAWAKQVKDGSQTKEIAFARSVTTLLNLTQQPSIADLLKKFGFTNPKDLDCLWDANGLFTMMNSDSCANNAGESFCKDLKHNAINGEASFLDLIDSDLTVSQLVSKLKESKDKLLSLSQSFEFAADNVNLELLSLSDATCGLEKLKFNKADLYAAAATMRAIVSALELADIYQHDFKVKSLVDFWFISDDSSPSYCSSFESMINDFNASLLVLKANANTEQGKEQFIRSIRLAHKALTAAKSQSNNGIFGWTELTGFVSNDLLKMMEKVLLASDNNTSIDFSDFLSLALKIDLNKFLANPVNRKANEKLFYDFSCTDTDYGYYEGSAKSTWDWALKFINDAVTGGSVFVENPDAPGELLANEELDFKLSSSWETLDGFRFADPNQYYENIGLCLGGDKPNQL